MLACDSFDLDKCLNILQELSDKSGDPTELIQDLLELLPPELQTELASSQDFVASLDELQTVLQTVYLENKEHKVQPLKTIPQESLESLDLKSSRPRTSPVNAKILSKPLSPENLNKQQEDKENVLLLKQVPDTPDFLKRPPTQFSSPWKSSQKNADSSPFVLTHSPFKSVQTPFKSFNSRLSNSLNAHPGWMEEKDQPDVFESSIEETAVR
jgi:hypothetical protein